MARSLSEPLIKKDYNDDCSTYNIFDHYVDHRDDDDYPSAYFQSLRNFMQKLVAEFMGTYLLLFAGFAAIVVNKQPNSTLPSEGVAIVWGLDVMVMTYTVAPISGAHFNPAVTLAFAIFNKFPWKHVLPYMSVQVVASTLASVTIQVIFGESEALYVGTLPSGSNMQSLALEFIITFYLLFSVCGVAANPAIRELAGLAAGAAITINAFIAGSTSGASMNPARSLGPAIAYNCYRGIWIYILGPTAGAIAGTWSYHIIKSRDKPSDRMTDQD